MLLTAAVDWRLAHALQMPTFPSSILGRDKYYVSSGAGCSYVYVHLFTNVPWFPRHSRNSTREDYDVIKIVIT